MSKLKRKGKFAYGKDLQRHQNHSSQIIAKCIEAKLIKGTDVSEFIHNHRIIPDFLIGAKVPRNSRLKRGDEYVENIIRYVISIDGEPLNKIMPSKGIEGQFKRANKLTDDYFNSVMQEIGLGIWDERIHTKNKSVYETDRIIGINTGFLVTIYNKLSDLNNVNINYDYYIGRVNKIVNKVI